MPSSPRIGESDARHPSSFWYRRLGFQILDPDGWDRVNFLESWCERITWEEFMSRVSYSTITTDGWEYSPVSVCQEDDISCHQLTRWRDMCGDGGLHAFPWENQNECALRLELAYLDGSVTTLDREDGITEHKWAKKDHRFNAYPIDFGTMNLVEAHAFGMKISESTNGFMIEVKTKGSPSVTRVRNGDVLLWRIEEGNPVIYQVVSTRDLDNEWVSADGE